MEARLIDPPSDNNLPNPTADYKMFANRLVACVFAKWSSRVLTFQSQAAVFGKFHRARPLSSWPTEWRVVVVCANANWHLLIKHTERIVGQLSKYSRTTTTTLLCQPPLDESHPRSTCEIAVECPALFVVCPQKPKPNAPKTAARLLSHQIVQ